MTKTAPYSVDLKKITFNYLEDGIIENYIKPSQTIDCDDVQEMQKQNRSMSQERPYTLLVIPGDSSTVTKEARELIASKGMVGIKLAKAFVLNSLAHKIVGNFYLTVNKPHLKTKIFTDREKALEWLREIVNSNRVSD